MIPKSKLKTKIAGRKRKRRYDLDPTFSRSGWFKQMASKSYWSYGKVNRKDGALIPEGVTAELHLVKSLE